MKKRYTPSILRAVIFASVIVFVTSLFSANPVVYSDNPASLIESDDPLVLRQGNWTAQAASRASGGSYLYSSSPDDVLTLYFTGPTIEVVYVAGTTLGILALEVDGTVLRSVITTAETTQFSSRAKIDYLTDEGHTLRVYASQGVVAVDAFYANTSLGYKPPLQENTALTAISSDNEPRLALLCDSGNQTVLVSRSTGTPGTSGDDNSYDPSISYDGRYVAFSSYATNLVSGDTNNRADIFVRDRYSCSTVRVSLNSTSGQALGFDSDYPSISANGNFVAFQSAASNLVTGDNNGEIDIFVRNIATGQTTRVSVGRYSTTPGGPIQTIQSNGYSVNPVISGDGRYVAFVSVANNLVQNDDNNLPDIFVHDLEANTTFRVSINSQGGEALGGGSYEPAISSDGNFIAFSSNAYNLVPNDTNGASDVFVHSRVPSQTIRVSLTWQGTQAQAPFPDSPDSASPSISADGNFVSFISAATNLVPYDPNNTSDVFVRNLQANPDETIIVSTRSDSQPSFGGTPYSSSVSQDGRLVVFLSDASDLIMPIYDTNNGTDVFAKSRQSGQTTRLSVFPNGTTQIPGGVGGSVMSQDGRYVTFVTTYSLVTDNYLNNADIYVVPAPDGWADTIALFGPATGGISLIDTLQDNPPLSAYTVMDTSFTTSSLNTYWVMGDWNGDGQKTPGYSANGVFFYTNDLIVDNNTIWSGIWIGLSGPAVAGHFMGGVPNDCIGAVDIKDFPPYGYGMALYFTCDFVDGTAPPLSFQWLGVPLPTDPPAPVNFYQFAAGDWNADGVETMAVRREQFIAFTNTPPTTYLSEMNLAQYFGTPCKVDTDSGVFVAGDWDNNGLDSFGLYCEYDPSSPGSLNARFYRRNDLDWNSGVYILQTVRKFAQTYGDVPVRAASWRLR